MLASSWKVSVEVDVAVYDASGWRGREGREKKCGKEEVGAGC